MLTEPVLFYPPSHRTSYFLGLDLGRRRSQNQDQDQDRPALVAVERRSRRHIQTDGVVVTRFCLEHQWRIIHAERIPPGVDGLRLQRRAAALARKLSPSCTLVVHASGPGAPVAEALRAALPGLRVVGVAVTPGSRAARGPGRWGVPSLELAGLLRRMIEQGDLRAAHGMSGWDQLREEMQSFVAAGPSAPSGKADLITALGLATWWGRRGL